MERGPERKESYSCDPVVKWKQLHQCPGTDEEECGGLVAGEGAVLMELVDLHVWAWQMPLPFVIARTVWGGKGQSLVFPSRGW